MTDKLPWMPFWGTDFYESETVSLMDRDCTALHPVKQGTA